MRVVTLLFLLAQPLAASAQTAPGTNPTKTTNYDERNVGTYTLPDPLRLPNGRPVRTVRQWEGEQRGTILNLFFKQVYGQIPGRPARMRFETQRVDTAVLSGKAIRKFVRVWLDTGAAAPHINLMLYAPKATRPAPVFVTLNYGNHTTSTDSTIPPPSRADLLPNPQPPKRGSYAHRWPYEQIIDGGFAIVTADYGDLEPDKQSGWQMGVRTTLQAQTGLKPAQWAAIGAWAWGMSRLLDYLETEPLVDARRAVVQGHSRLGKAALWAGANDPRFALVISNNSGEGGAALARRNFGETVKTITDAFPYWFVSRYATYAHRVAELPIDQHELLALIAPRPLLVASAKNDDWSDQRGEFLALKAAAPVWALYGKPAHLTDMPAVDQPIWSGPLGYYVRTGNHDVLPYDWTQYMAFARKMGM